MTNLENEEILQKLKNILKPHQILTQVSMKEYTSMKVGITVEIMVLPASIQEIRDIKILLNEKHIPHDFMGNGTNLIVVDAGFPGAILKLGDNFANASVNGEEITAQAGCNLVAASNLAWKHSLTGLEFAAGIPGNIGGAVVMNAGAYGGEMKDVVIETTCMNDQGEIITLHGEEHEFGYRTSRIQKQKLLVLETKMKLLPGEPDKIKEKMQDFNSRRREKQPLSLPSAGSVFKRPVGFFAGKLIEEAGLRGHRIGGAQVSEKHCGFIVNTGNATAADVINLIKYVQDKVFHSSGVMLETEVRILGG